MAAEEKSPRNKTIDISVEQGRSYLKRCLQFSGTEAVRAQEILDRTILGDSFTVMEHLPSSFADLAIVDPPYNLTKKYAGKEFSKRSSSAYKIFTENWLQRLLPLLKSDATLYICCDWQSSIVIADVLAAFESDKKLHIRNRITWEREKGRGATHNWKNSMEDIWFATLSGNYTFNLDTLKIRRKVIAPYRQNGVPKDWEQTPQGAFRTTCPSNFWDDISVPYWSMPENTAHPTQKPEKLLAKLILASSKPGDIVFGPFLGSGSTSVTAKKLGRHWCGIEQNEQYCIWAEKRLETADTDTTIQGYENGIFYERNSAPSSHAKTQAQQAPGL